MTSDRLHRPGPYKLSVFGIDNQFMMNYNIFIVADLRGSFLQPYLDQFNQWPNVTYEVKIYKGRGIRELWRHARELLLHNVADFVYIFVGICNLTSKFKVNGRREFWIGKRPRDKILDLSSLINSIGDEALRLNLYAKIAFLQEIGCDLLRYNQIAVPALWMLQQESDLDEDLLLAQGGPWCLMLTVSTLKSLLGR